MPDFTLQVAFLAVCVAAAVMTIGFTARETRWGMPLLAIGVVGLLLIIALGIVSKL